MTQGDLKELYRNKESIDAIVDILQSKGNLKEFKKEKLESEVLRIATEVDKLGDKKGKVIEIVNQMLNIKHKKAAILNGAEVLISKIRGIENEVIVEGLQLETNIVRLQKLRELQSDIKQCKGIVTHLISIDYCSNEVILGIKELSDAMRRFITCNAVFYVRVNKKIERLEKSIKEYQDKEVEENEDIDIQLIREDIIKVFTILENEIDWYI